MPAYVPPHLRNKGPDTSSRSSSVGSTSSRSNVATPTFSNGAKMNNSRDQASSSKGPALPLKRAVNSYAPQGAAAAFAKETPNQMYHRKAAQGPTRAFLVAHGDSFVGPLSLLPYSAVEVYRYSGATAKGLNNPNSTLNVSTDLLAVSDVRQCPNLFLQFGNVDINLGSIHAILKYGRQAWNEKTYVERMIKEYITFLELHILSRLVKAPKEETDPADDFITIGQAPSTPTTPQTPQYIKTLYIATSTMPIVDDDILPLSFAKYQKKPDPVPPNEDGTIPIRALQPIKEVEDLIDLIGLQARKRMTRMFNDALVAFVEKYADNGLRIADVNKFITIRHGAGGTAVNGQDSKISKEGADSISTDIGQTNGDSTTADATQKQPITQNSMNEEDRLDHVLPEYKSDDRTNLHALWEESLPFWIQELSDTGLNESHIPQADALESTRVEYEEQVKQKISRRRIAELAKSTKELTLDDAALQTP